jgi:hypothetical protein
LNSDLSAAMMLSGRRSRRAREDFAQQCIATFRNKDRSVEIGDQSAKAIGLRR